MSSSIARVAILLLAAQFFFGISAAKVVNSAPGIAQNCNAAGGENLFLTATPESPTTVGTPVRFSFFAEGPGTFQLEICENGETVATIDCCVWTPTKPGSFTVQMHRSDGSSSQPTRHEVVPEPEPEPEPVIALTPSGTSSRTGDTLEMTATVTQDSKPIAEVLVNFTAQMSGNTIAPCTGVETDGSGSARCRYARDVPGRDKITAIATSVDPQPQTSVFHTWIGRPVELNLRVEPRTSPVGSTVTATATVSSEGTASPNVSVRLGGTAPDGGAVDLGEKPTNPSGQATFPVQSQIPGTQSLTATATVAGVTYTATSEISWTSGGLTIEASPAETIVGNSAIVTVAVFEQGEPAAGVEVAVTSELPGATGNAPVSLVTRSDGTATYSDRQDVAGVEKLTATAALDGTVVRDTTTVTWRPRPGLKVVLGPAGVTPLVGDELTVTAVVTDADGPVEEATVDFQAVMPGGRNFTGEAVTNVDGIANFSYMRALAGSDRVHAQATAGPLAGDASLPVTWISAPGFDVDLEPDGTSSEVGANFTAVVTVTDDRRPVSGTLVDFAVTSKGLPPLDPVQSPSTGPAGRARHTYSRAAAGIDTVTATLILPNDAQVTAAIVHTWTPPQPTPCIELDRTTTVPGGSIVATGTTIPNGDITIQVDGTDTTHTTADDTGDYRTIVTLDNDAQLGPHSVRATCSRAGDDLTIHLAGSSSSTGQAAAAGTAAAAVLAFFVLLGTQLLRHRTTRSASKTATE